jgi:hypothetical protein
VPASPIPVRYDADLGWGYPPRVRVRHRDAEFDVELRFDAAGRRGGGIDPAGPPVAVFVGDSLTLGWAVAEEETFAVRTGRALGFQTANLGVAGYGTDQSYLKLLRDGLPLRPALVVYTFCRNDLAEVLHGRRYGRSKPRFRQQEDRLVLSPVAERTTFLERHSALYGSFQSFLQGRRDGALSEAETREARRLVLRLTRAMAAASRNAGSRFVLITDGDSWLAAALTGLGPEVLYADARPFLRQAAGEGPVRFASDPHWNGCGHAAVAAAVVRTLAAAPPAGPRPAGPAGRTPPRAAAAGRA